MTINKQLIKRRVQQVYALRSNLVEYKAAVDLTDLETLEVDMKIEQCDRIFSRLADRLRKYCR